MSSAFIDDGYTLKATILGNDQYPTVTFTYRPALSHERSALNERMSFATENSEVKALEQARTTLCLGLASAIDTDQRTKLQQQIARLSDQIIQVASLHKERLEAHYEQSERLAAKFMAGHIVEWNLDRPPTEDNCFKLHPELSAKLFGVLYAYQKSDNAEDETFNETETLGN